MRKTLLFSILFVITLGITIPQSYASPGEWKIDPISPSDSSKKEFMEISYEADVKGTEIVCLIQMATFFINGEPYMPSLDVINQPILGDGLPLITDNRASNFVPIAHVEPDWVGVIDISPTNESPIPTSYFSQVVEQTSGITTLYNAGLFVNEGFSRLGDSRGTTCATPQNPIARFTDEPSMPLIKRIIITDENSQSLEMQDIIPLFENFTSRDGVRKYSIDATDQDLKDLLENTARPIDISLINGVELEVVALKIDSNGVSGWLDSQKWGIYIGPHGALSIVSYDYETASPTCAFLKVAQTWNDSTKLIKLPGIPDIASCTNLSNPGSLLASLHQQITSKKCCGTCAVQ